MNRAVTWVGQVALTPLYLFYERRLLLQVRRHPMPRHVGLILDGNRRYGRSFSPCLVRIKFWLAIDLNQTRVEIRAIPEHWIPRFTPSQDSSST
jgi:hypothetical protein